jgi:hypothetical protein
MFAQTKKSWILFGLLVLVFIALRVPALQIPYHQDEYKWILYSHPEIIPPGTVPHPPLTEFLYTRLGPIFGDNNFRAIPYLFSVIDLLLIIWLATIIFKSEKAALWTGLLFTISFYSVLASVMVDVDGAVMPFFLLLLAIGYYKWKESNWKNWKWLILVFVGAIGGFLIKLSALLPVVAFALDFAIEKNIFNDTKKVLRFIGYVAVGVVVLALILIGSKLLFPFFNLSYSLTYWEHFAVFKNRGWFQTFIQFAKSLLYTSPLLVIPVFLVNKELWKKTRPFFLFIFLGLFFYLIAFDFSLGALDRYFQFFVVPTTLITAGVLTYYFQGPTEKKITVGMILGALVIFLLQFIPQHVPPLYPKTEWLHRAISFRWNFLFPFTGGSGPTGFYISFLFMALIWIVSVVLTILYFSKHVSKRNLLLGILVLGIVYNGVFIEEFVWGKINGDSSTLIKHAAALIDSKQRYQQCHGL